MNSKCGFKARENAKATSLAFVLLDFRHAGVRRRAQCTRPNVVVLFYAIAVVGEVSTELSARSPA